MSLAKHHLTALVPIYHWRGARPWLIDLESHQTGWLTALSLQREGDICLLPLAWEAETPEDSSFYARQRPYPGIQTDALDSTAVTLTLAQLQQDGWQINGRLTIQFTGTDTDPNFQQTYLNDLWQAPDANKQ